MRELNDITGIIIGAALGIHRDLGPGCFESVYGTLLVDDLRRDGLKVEAQKKVPLTFRGRKFKKAFRPDLIVEDAVIIELKSVQVISNVVPKQLLTYLRLMNMRVGLVLNFGSESLGIKRVINSFEPSPSAKSAESA